MQESMNLENIGNPEVLEEITNWSKIKNNVRIRNERGDDGKMYTYLDPQLEDLTLGERLSFVRQFRRLTQDEVSEYLGLEGENKRRTITRYETNKRVPNEERLRELRKLYRVNINSIKPYDFSSLEDSVYIYYKGTNTTIHEYLTYLVALVAFWSISSAIYAMIKYKKNHTPILKAVKLTNFANALTSIMLTQIVLLDTYANTNIYNSNLMNGLTGMAIGITIVIIGVYMIIGINKVTKID